jgi:hypothetical protein
MREERRSRFVGRVAELELIRTALRDSQPSFSVLFVHGPGGVGKTALLMAIADLCEADGAPATRLDLRTIEPSPPAFTDALADLLSLPGAGDIAAGLAAGGRRVLLLDTYEAAGPLAGWLRDHFLPSLPGEMITVIAGRNAPDRRWLVDPGWQPLLRVVALRNLGPADVREYLARVRVRRDLHDRVLELTHGHPLAVSLLVEVLAQRDARDRVELPAGLAEARDVLAALLERFVQDVPTDRHRRAVEICAHTQYTTEGLLRDVIGADAAGMFDWLPGLSFVEEGAHGLFPHDLAREVLNADARWRDPAGFAEVHHAVRTHLLRRIQAGRAGDHQAVADFHFLHRANPFTAAYWDWEVSRDAFTDHLRPGDSEQIVAMTERHEGPEAAEIAGHWLARHPQGFVVFRAGERAIGFTLLLHLNEIGDEDIARDPGAQAIWAYIHARRPPRPGGTVRACRFLVDAEAYQDPSVSLTLAPVAHLRRIFGDPARDWDVLAPWASEETVAPLMSYIDFHRVPEADYEVGGKRYAAFAHDWRRCDLEEWLDVLEAREIAPGWEPPQPGSAPAPMLALSHAEFAEAVREALKDLHRDAALAASPLLSARIARDRSEEPAPGALRELIFDAVASLRADPRDEKLARALVRTYLRPAGTQEAAAELLDLPFSTYRRHLKRGVERVTELLWSWELYGRSE